MARITNYGELKTEVANLLHRSNLASSMDIAAQITEREIMLTGRMWQLHVSQSISEIDRVFPGSAEYFLPGDFWGLVRVFTTTGGAFNTELNPATSRGLRSIDFVDQLSELRATNGTIVPPSHYTVDIASAAITISPLPAEDEFFKVQYYQAPPIMVADADFNILLTFAPQLYLYGMVKYLARKVQDMELATLYESYWEQQITLANDTFFHR